MYVPRIFVSHSGADDGFCRQLVDDLRMYFDDSDAIWYDRAGGIWAGDDWWNEILKQLTSREIFIVVLSPEAMASKWVQAEIAIAWNEKVTSGRRIIPVLYRATSGRADLNTLHIISFENAAVRSDYEKSLRDLIDAIRTQPNETGARRPAIESKNITPVQLLVLDAQQDDGNQPLLHGAGSKRIAALEQQLEEIGNISLSHGDPSRFSALRKLVQDTDVDIVHFVGRGTQDIQLTERAVDGSATPEENLTRLLRYGLLPMGVHLLVLDDWGGVAQVTELVPLVPYILRLSRDDSVGQHAPTLFMREFYTSYAQDRSVEKAFEDAKFVVDVLRISSSLEAELLNRARRSVGGQLTIQVRVRHFPNPLIVHLGAVEAALDNLGIPRQQVLDLLARKIQVHSWIFSTPRDSVVLPVGSNIIGMFSWDGSSGVIKCDRLFKVKDDINPEHWEGWCRLLIAYNDLCGEEYRTLKEPSDPSAKYILERAINRCEVTYRTLQDSIAMLEKAGFHQARLSYSLATAFFEKAQDKFVEDNLAMTVSFLESALTSIHDIVSSCLPETTG